MKFVKANNVLDFNFTYWPQLDGKRIIEFRNDEGG